MTILNRYFKQSAMVDYKLPRLLFVCNSIAVVLSVAILIRVVYVVGFH